MSDCDSGERTSDEVGNAPGVGTDGADAVIVFLFARGRASAWRGQ